MEMGSSNWYPRIIISFSKGYIGDKTQFKFDGESLEDQTTNVISSCENFPYVSSRFGVHV